MTIPDFLKGESLARLFQGAALGAILVMLLGFKWGGWTLGSTAERQAKEQTNTAVVSSLAPICVDNFQSSSEAVANLAELKELSSYKRSGYIDNGGWAVLPGSDKAGSGVAKACANLLTEL